MPKDEATGPRESSSHPHTCALGSNNLDVLGCSVVSTLNSTVGGADSIPGGKLKILHAWRCGKKKKKESR